MRPSPPIRIIRIAAFLLALCAVQTGGADLRKFGDEMAYFYLAPTKEKFDALQTKADQLYDELKKTGGKGEILAGVFLAKVAMKHRWEITGNGAASAVAKDVVQGTSNFAKYVNNDTMVDLHKLDIWWSSFFATGDNEYLAKILKYARRPQPGEHAADFMMPAMAAWSFKSNCAQHRAVAAFAKDCLENNRFPAKNDFLRQCIAFAEQTRRK
jgi:hypothetical protein